MQLPLLSHCGGISLPVRPRVNFYLFIIAHQLYHHDQLILNGWEFGAPNSPPEISVVE